MKYEKLMWKMNFKGKNMFKTRNKHPVALLSRKKEILFVLGKIALKCRELYN